MSLQKSSADHSGVTMAGLASVPRANGEAGHRVTGPKRVPSLCCTWLKMQGDAKPKGTLRCPFSGPGEQSTHAVGPHWEHTSCPVARSQFSPEGGTQGSETEEEAERKMKTLLRDKFSIKLVGGKQRTKDNSGHK